MKPKQFPALLAAITMVSAFQFECFGQEVETASFAGGDVIEIQTCDSCCQGSWGAGVEVLFLEPHFESNRAFTLAPAAFGVGNRTTQEFDYDWEASSRLFLEYVQYDGMGVRGSYWQYDGAANTVNFAFGAGTAVVSPTGLTPQAVPTQLANGNPGTAVVDSGVDAYTIDLELLQRVDALCGVVELGGGVRHGAIAQDYRIFVDSAAGADGDALVNHRFDGLGPTLFGQYRRPVRGCVSLVAGARTSVLFGNGKFSVRENAAGAIRTDRTERDDTLTILELSIGAEWTTCTNYGELFARASWEGQSWLGAGSATSEEGNLSFGGLGILIGVAR